MKKIKYILFSILLGFIYINNVSAATCVYDSPASFPNKFSITCTGNNNCTVSSSLNISIASNAVNVQIGDTCPSKIFITISDNNTISSINTSNNGEALNLNKSKSKEGSGGSTVKPPVEDSPITNTEYENDGRYIEAKKDADKYCNEQDFVYYDSEKCEYYRGIMNNIKNTYQSGTSDTPNGSYTPNSFCTNPTTRGAFRVIGWAIFIIKIVIPILLIVLGSIDIGKAIVSSKDDEIKKSIKTLVVRAIAGIIIFLVPTVLNFVLKIFDGNNIYDEMSGSFGYCTHCMLDPTDEYCGSLMGGK